MKKEMTNLIKQIEVLENNDHRTMDEDTVLDNLIQQADDILFS